MKHDLIDVCGHHAFGSGEMVKTNAIPQLDGRLHTQMKVGRPMMFVPLVESKCRIIVFPPGAGQQQPQSSRRSTAVADHVFGLEAGVEHGGELDSGDVEKRISINQSC